MTTPKELVESHIPNYFLEQYPHFVKFIEEYYNFLESSVILLTDNKKLSVGDIIYGSLSKAKAIVKIVTKDRVYFDYETETNNFYRNELLVNGISGEIYFIKKLYKNIHQYAQDIEENTNYETALTVFQKYFKKNVSLDHSIFRRLDPNILTKKILDYYKNKDTENSYYWFFRIFFDDIIELYYPKVDILRLSDSGYYEQNLIQIEYNSSISKFNQTRIYAPKSKASAICRDIITKNQNNTTKAFLDLVYINGTFKENEIIVGYDITTGLEAVKGVIKNSITGLKITDGGIGHKVGDMFNYGDGRAEITKLKKHSITNIKINDPGLCYRVGDPIVFDNAFTNAEYTASAYVSEIEVNPTLTTYFNSFYNILKNRPVSFYEDETLLDEVYENSILFRDATPLKELPSDVVTDFQMGGIKEITFDDSGLGYEFAPPVVAKNPLPQAELLNYFDVIFDNNEANTAYIQNDTLVYMKGGTSTPGDFNEAICIGDVTLNADEEQIYLSDLDILSEDVEVKRFITLRSVKDLETDTFVEIELGQNERFDNNQIKLDTILNDFSEIGLPFGTTLNLEIKDLIKINPLANSAKLESVLGDGVAQIKTLQMGLMTKSDDVFEFIHNPEERVFNQDDIAHGLKSEYEYEEGLFIDSFDSFLDNRSKLSSNKYIHDGYYYQNYSYEIRTKIPASLIEPLLLDELHPAGFLHFIRNKFELELDFRIKTHELHEIEIDSRGYIIAEIFEHIEVERLNFADATIGDVINQIELENEFIHNEEIATSEYPEIEVNAIAPIFEGFRFFIEDIISKPSENSFRDFDDYGKTNEKNSIITDTRLYDGIVAVQSFVKIINVEDEANWIADVIGYRKNAIGSLDADRTIYNFRVRVERVFEHVPDIAKGGYIVVRDPFTDLYEPRFSSDLQQFSNAEIEFSDTERNEYLPLVSGNTLSGKGSYLPNAEILTRDYGWVTFENLEPYMHVANVKEDGVIVWQLPDSIATREYNGIMHQYTDHSSVSITVSPDQELALVTSNKIIKGRKLSSKTKPPTELDFLAVPDETLAGTGKRAIMELRDIDKEIDKIEVPYTGLLYCLTLKNNQDTIKVPFEVDEGILEVISWQSFIENNYTLPKVTKIEKTFINVDYENVAIDLESYSIMQPRSNTIIFDYNTVDSTPYPIVNPSEIFFLTSAETQPTTQPSPQGPLTVEPLRTTFQNSDVITDEVDVVLTLAYQQEFKTVLDTFEHKLTERPTTFTSFSINIKDFLFFESTSTLSNDSFTDTAIRSVTDVPLHVVINIDEQILPLSIQSSDEENNSAVFLNIESTAAKFDIQPAMDKPKNRISTLSFENRIPAIRGKIPKIFREAILINSDDDKKITQISIADIETVLCPDHQFEPKAKVVILNFFEEFEKNRVSSLILLGSINAHPGTESGLPSVEVEDDKILNYHHIDSLQLKEPDLRYVITRLNFADSSSDTDPVIYYTFVNSTNKSAYGIKPSSYFDSDELTFDSYDNFTFDEDSLLPERKLFQESENFNVDTLVTFENIEDLDNLKPIYNEDNFIIWSTIVANDVNSGDIDFMSVHVNHINNFAFEPFSLDPSLPSKSIQQDFTVIPPPVHKFVGISESGFDPLSTLVSGGDNPAVTDVTPLETDVNRKIFVDVLNRNLFFNFDEKIVDYKNNFIVYNLHKKYKPYLGDTMPATSALSEPFLYTSPKSKDLSTVLDKETIYFANTVILDSSTEVISKTDIENHFEIEDRRKYITLDTQFENWKRQFIAGYLPVKFSDYVLDKIPSAFIQDAIIISKRTANEDVSPLVHPNSIFSDAAPPAIYFELELAEAQTEIKIPIIIEDRNKYVDLGDIILPWTPILIKDYSRIKMDDYILDKLPSVRIDGTYIRNERQANTELLTNFELFSSLYGNTTFLDSSFDIMGEIEEDIENNIIDRNKLIIRSDYIYPYEFTIIEHFMRPWVIREYSQDTLPSVTAYLEVVPITDYVENMEVINIDNRILTGNTTFLDATQDIDFEFEIKNENLILDRHKTFSLSDIIGPWTDNTLFGFYRPLQLKYYNLSDIPTVRVHSEPEITYNPIVLANTEIVSFTTLYGNTAFADATHDVTFEYGFEDDTIIVDRNKTFAEDRVISRWVDTKFSLDMIPKIFVDFESETVPTATVLNEPEITYNPKVPIDVNIVPFTTLYGNTAFADATTDIYSVIDEYEHNPKLLDRNVTLSYEDRITSYFNNFVDDYLPFKLVPYNLDYIPTVSVLNELEFTYNPTLDLIHTAITSSTTVYDKQATILDNTIATEEVVLEFENLVEFISDKSKIGRKDFIINKQNEIIGNYLNSQIAEHTYDTVKTVDVGLTNNDEIEYVIISDMEELTSDEISILYNDKHTFIDSTSFMDSTEIEFFSESYVYNENSAISLNDRITESFLEKQIRPKVLTKLRYDIINTIPIVSPKTQYSITTVDIQDGKSKFKETVSNIIGTEKILDGTIELIQNENLTKIFNEIEDRNFLFQLDKKVDTFLKEEITEKVPLKLKYYILESNIPTVQAELFAKEIFDYSFSTTPDDISLVDFEKILSFDSEGNINNTFGFKESQINTINNGITNDNFLLNTVIRPFTDDYIRFEIEKHLKRKGDDKQTYLHATLKMNYTVSEVYTWNISALNTFETEYNDPNINRKEFLETVRIEV